jgi:hypothetical protein
VRVFPIQAATFLILAAALGLIACGPGESIDEDRQEGWVPGLEGAWSSPHPGAARSFAIEGIGYGGGSEETKGASGVRMLVADQVLAAPRLYTSGHGPEAILISFSGRVLHRWHCDWRSLPSVPALDGPTQNTFRRALLLPQGDLLAIFGGRGLVRMDAKAKPRWVYTERAHHDLTLDEQGQLWTLIRKETIEPRLGHSSPIVDDFIVQLDLQSGQELRRISVLEALLQSPAAKLVHEARVKQGDFLHTNTLEILNSEKAALHPSWKPGQALICLRELDALAVVDLEAKRAVWYKAKAGVAPHEPETTQAGTLLLFDNHGNQGASVVREFALPGFKQIWSHKGQPPDQFFSRFCGAAHRLSNGNTLIVESNRGLAFELDPDGNRVWEFANPERAGKGDRWIAAIFDLFPIPGNSPEADLSWLPE